jgi:hypothetical protein
MVNGLHGLAIDSITSIEFAVASDELLLLTPDSTGQRQELFNVLCGAGYGFGVVTSITMKAWPIRELNMENDKVWTRKLIFTAPAIHTAAELFVQLQHPTDPRLIVTMLLMPGRPPANNPMILLSATFLGPSADAEKATAPLFDSKFTSKAVLAETALVPMSSLNDAAEPLNRHGDFKENYSTWQTSISPAAIVRAFERWLRFGEDTPDAKATSYVVFVAKSTKGVLEQDKEDNEFFPRHLRKRNVFVQVVPWWSKSESEISARGWANEMLGIVGAPLHSGDKGDEVTRVNAFAANMSKGIDVRTVWPEKKLEEIRRAKSVWDPGGLFWCPAVDGV